MSPSLLKMWISLAGMGFMFFAIILIYFSRYKLKGFFKIVTAIIAYILMILSGIIIFFVVFSGPTA
jgi:amino acid transporter